MQENNNNLKTI